jgi:acyl-CoA reductase-like NAD-dependent aldehyde dehydrogenase
MKNPSASELQQCFWALQRLPTLNLAERQQRLGRLYRALESKADALVEAVSQDFGRRAEGETRLADIALVLADIRHTRKGLPRWVQPRPVPVGIKFWPSKARLIPQPLGVAGIVSPWNYPVNLALSPLVAAVAAGNRVMLKPSELTPATNAVLRSILTTAFDPEEVVMVEGEAETAAAFSRLPFGHLLFTGSTTVGRQVMQAAACQLTPVTLELGGKSPVIVDDSAKPARFMPSLLAGKLFNAGQTCIAPDYVLLEAAATPAFLRAARQTAQALYGHDILNNPDYTAIINSRHFQRLESLLAELPAESIHWPLGPLTEAHRQRRIFPPALVINPPADSRLMSEEIFGPLLPVLERNGLTAKIAEVNSRPHPLTLYFFGQQPEAIARVRKETLSGSLCVNETLVQFAQDNLPFGGVGASGLGRYHGQAGFETFSHLKPVYYQSRLNANGLIRPPFGAWKKRLIQWLARL